MEDVVIGPPFEDVYRDRRVLVTGHTGFKGGWLSLWLQALGSHVIGIAQPPETMPNFFEIARVGDGMQSVVGDVRNLGSLSELFHDEQPEMVFHLAAQSLVRTSYVRPVETLATNIMGTAHVLEAARQTSSVRVVVVVTSDKCYENRERSYAYRENDRMGGADPYSVSKGAAELVTASYRRSFFSVPEGGDPPRVSVSTARAGNVIGGGDWAEDRIVPDCIRALSASKNISVRNPRSIRPWQHVLEPLSGYLWLGARMWQDAARFAGPWNFGPAASGVASVSDLVEHVVENWGSGGWLDASDEETNTHHEARSLKLDCTKASDLLGWRSILPLDRAVRETVSWYRRHSDDPDFDGRRFSLERIDWYHDLARESKAPWVAVPSGRPDP